MNVIQYQDYLRQVLKNNPSPEITVPETDLELETRDIPITLPKTAWKLIDNFEQSDKRKKFNAAQLFEETVINSLLCNQEAIMVQIVKVGD